MDPLEAIDTGSGRTDAARALLVINPHSGAATAEGGPDTIEAKLRDVLATRDTALEVLRFDPATFEHALEAALQAPVARLFVAGGDGSVLAVVEALKGRKVPIGIIPLGTMNWLARDLGIPLDPIAAIDTLADAPVRAIDAGSVNGRLFLCACMIGFGPILARWRENERGDSPWLLWPKILWRALGLLQRYRHLRLTLQSGGSSERLESRTLVVTNNLIAASIGPMPLRARLDAGKLGIYAVRKATAGQLARLGAQLMVGNWQADDTVLTEATPKATLSIAGRRSLILMLDGERTRLRTPLRLEAMPGQVLALAPEAST